MTSQQPRPKIGLLGLTLELYQVLNQTGGAMKTYSEIQIDTTLGTFPTKVLGKTLGSKLEAFYRAEIGDHGRSATHLFGVRKTL